MAAQLNKQAQKDTVATTQKKIQVGEGGEGVVSFGTWWASFTCWLQPPNLGERRAQSSVRMVHV
jgi:hypothetical protein